MRIRNGWKDHQYLVGIISPGKLGIHRTGDGNVLAFSFIRTEAGILLINLNVICMVAKKIVRFYGGRVTIN